MGGYAHDFIGTAQKSGHVKTVSDEAGGVYTFVKEFIVQNATLNYYWPSYCRKVVIKMVAGGSGAQGNWAGSSSGRTGAIAQGTVLKQNLTANEQNGIDAKIHYPIPMHLQKPSKEFGYKKGDFKKAELMAKKVLSLPVHEFITIKEINYVCYLIEEFYNKG